MLYSVSSVLPFAVCLMWTVSLGLDMLIYKRTEMQRRALFVLAAVCALLYLCHAAHFLLNPGFSIWDCIYTFCTLAVYPLFYWHICTLTQERPDRRGLLILLLPSAAASIWALAAFVVGGQGGTVRLVTGLAVPLEVLAVCVLGMRRLMEFKYKVENFYADVEGKTLVTVQALLVVFVVISMASAVASLIGRDAFFDSKLLALPSFLFSALLFTLFYLCSRIGFSVADIPAEPASQNVQEPAAESPDLLFARIEALMEQKQIFRNQGLKITDVAAAVGSNRTYVSNSINRCAGKSFSDYVHFYRIRYAKVLMLLGREGEPETLEAVAEKAGYQSGNSFYRAFVKFEGKSPSEWLKAHRQ